MSQLDSAERVLLPAASRLGALAAERRWPLLVWTAMVAWSAALVVLVRSYFLGFRFGHFDLGNMVQAVWSTAHGRLLETTLGTGEQALRLASHVDPILVLLAPAWLIWPSPLLLAFVQIAACALGALPVFWLGRRHLESESSAALLALAYLAYPWLAWTALDAMHPVTLAIPLFLYAIWFLDTDRLWPFAICAVLILATGELMGVTLAALGLWYWLARGHRRAGLLIAAFSFVWSVVAIKVVIPHFHGEESAFYAYYASVGGSPEGVFRTLVTDPATIAREVIGGREIGYLVALTAPLGGAFLLAPGLVAPALPQLAANSLSTILATTDPARHHVSAVIPFLVAASVLGVGRLPSSAHRLRASVAVLALCIGLSATLGPWPGVLGPPSPYGKPSPDHVEALRHAVSLVPDEAPVAATNKAGSHLADRRHMFAIPVLGNAEWVVLDMRDAWVPLSRPGSIRWWGREDRRLLNSVRLKLVRSPEWKKVSENGGVFVFRRAGA